MGDYRSTELGTRSDVPTPAVCRGARNFSPPTSSLSPRRAQKMSRPVFRFTARRTRYTRARAILFTFFCDTHQV